MEILGNSDQSAQSPHPSLTVVVAVNISTNSKYAVKWALKNLLDERIQFKLLHIRPLITTVPTPLGHYPISQVRDDVVAAYKKDVDWKTQKMLLPYEQIFIQKKVEVETLVIEADNVAEAIAREVSKLENSKLVIGASSSSRFKWNSKSKGVSSRISECIPSFCTVYAVKQGKLSSVRPSNSDTDQIVKNGCGDADASSSRCSDDSFSSQIDDTVRCSNASYSHSRSSSLVIQRFQALSNINQGLLKSRSVSSSSRTSSTRSLQMDLRSWDTGQESTSDSLTHSSSESKVDINFELEKLRIELRHARGMYVVAKNETIFASRQLNSLNQRWKEEAQKFQEINTREEQTRESARQEKEKHEAAEREAELLRGLAEREALLRKGAEYRATCDANETQKLKKVLEGPFEPYKKFTWEEIVSATSSFSDDLRIGMGAYGTVYKCTLNHVTAAVKVLHLREGQDTKGFQRELDILSKIRHPHLLLLLGVCPDHKCLVYEYMENGSLEERLLQNSNTLPLPWFERYRIAWEIASALVFLHNSRPRPIVHRDIKPANILLDHNLVSKIGDVGLSALLPSIVYSQSPISKDTGLAGTLCYIDPEYQRNGLVSPKCDVYAFGMVILQLLTAKPALALAHIAETALENGLLLEILDPKAGNWPIEETKELALLGLKCVEIKQRDRPDLNFEVLPVLERLKKVAYTASNPPLGVQPAPPNCFICPLLKEVMEDPCVAADGYTYDRKALQVWLENNDKSPMTKLPLQHKTFIPDHSLLSAIMEWKSGKQRHQPQSLGSFLNM